MLMQRPVNRRGAAAGGGYARVFPVTAPVGGWNPGASIVNMRATDAILLENWFPDTDGLRARTGYTSHATSVGSGAVETLWEHRNASATKLIAASDGKVYDVTSAGSATQLATGFSADRWQPVNFNDVTLLFNGADTPQSYDGSTVGSAGFSGSGLTASDLVQGCVFTERLYVVESGSGSVWYGGAGSITGTLTEFDIGQYASGGELMAVGAWTRDGGAGIDDYFVAVFASGEVLVYQGTNPATDFSLVGRYLSAEPIGRRCLVQFGGELVIITRGGYVPVSFIMSGGVLAQLDNHPVFGKIRAAVRDAAGLYGGNAGWWGHVCPSGCAAWFNVPTSASGTSEQHALNVLNGAWTKYRSTAVQPQAMASRSGVNYVAGADATVYSVSGANDDGSDITLKLRTAFVYPASAQRRVTVNAVRPIVSLEGFAPGQLALEVDFTTDRPGYEVTFGGGQVGTKWDTAKWDTFKWGGDAQPQSHWLTIDGSGQAFSLSQELAVNGQSAKFSGHLLSGIVGGTI